MSYDLRNTRVSYDNIAVGSAISEAENLAVGANPPSETYGGGTNVAVGSAAGEENTIDVATDPTDEIIG